MTDTTGKTKDAGWEVGVRTTAQAPVPAVWEFLAGAGLSLWLGRHPSPLPTAKGAEYETVDDIRGRIISYADGYRVRLTWQPTEWDHDSTLQLTVKATETGTRVALHQEGLSGREERKIMLAHWKEVIDDLDAALSALV